MSNPNLVRLTTDHPASHYGVPILVDGDGNSYGPKDVLGEQTCGVWTAGMFVSHMSLFGDFLGSDIVGASLFCSQDPDGPQIQGALVGTRRGNRGAVSEGINPKT